jgi:hypothetical protein
MAGQRSATDTGTSEYTSIHVRRDVRDRLKALKPYDSMSFNDLFEDMAEQYDPRQPEIDTDR